ncbi:ribonuclease toxin immunity protein CdiI [Ralstonia pseudosolanacearum]|uniref:ribonuclease toxin immunity protein CdiI n=2 Tax=Ralstonia pseudosolanacearum TaxID=1310165 RepID=UPI001181C2A8
MAPMKSESTQKVDDHTVCTMTTLPFPVCGLDDPHWVVKSFLNYLYQQGALVRALDHITSRNGYAYNDEYCFFPDPSDPDPVYHFEGVAFGIEGTEEVVVTEDQCWCYVRHAANHYLQTTPSDAAVIADLLKRIDPASQL